MDYQEFKEKTDRIYKLAMRKKDLALALKCVEMQYKFAQEKAEEDKKEASEKKFDIKKLTSQDLVDTLIDLEGMLGIDKTKSFKNSPLYKQYGHKL